MHSQAHNGEIRRRACAGATAAGKAVCCTVSAGFLALFTGISKKPNC